VKAVRVTGFRSSLTHRSGQVVDRGVAVGRGGFVAVDEAVAQASGRAAGEGVGDGRLGEGGVGEGVFVRLGGAGFLGAEQEGSDGCRFGARLQQGSDVVWCPHAAAGHDRQIGCRFHLAHQVRRADF